MAFPMAFRKWVGIGLILLSGVWFAGILMTPFLALPLGIKAIVGVAFAALMEVSFWLGSLIVGKQIISRYWLSIKRHLGLGPKIVANDPSQHAMDNPTKASSLENAPDQALGHQGKGLVFLEENLPYVVMIIIGVAIFLLGFGIPFVGWLSATLYAAYGVIGALWIIVFVCPYCPNFGSGCFSGHGQISKMFMPKKDESKFVKKFKGNIPAIIPIYAIPTIAGLIFFGLSLSYVMLLRVIAFAVNSYYIAPLISGKVACANCSVREECPWYRKGSSSKK
jgi:hypothetical protein